MTNKEITVMLAKTIGYLKGLSEIHPSVKDMTKEASEGCYAAINALLDKKAYKPQPGPDLDYTTDCCCGNCDTSIFREDRFCRMCGSQIDWSNE